MPTFASLVQSARHRLARWLLPEIHQLLVQRIDEETSAAGQPDTHERLQQSVDTSSECAVPRPEPPADWVARVREGAPQLLIGERQGGVPSVRFDDLSATKGPGVVGPQHTNRPVGSHTQSNTRQESNQMTSSGPVHREGPPASPPHAEVPSGPARTAFSRADATRARIAKVIHAVGRALAGKDSLASNQEINPAAETPKQPRGSQPQLHRQDSQVRSVPPEPELPAGKVPGWEGRERSEDLAVADAAERRRKPETYKVIRSKDKELRRLLLPSVRNWDEHVAPHVVRERLRACQMQPDKRSDLFPASAPLDVQSERREPPPAYHEPQSGAESDRSGMPSALTQQNRRFSNLPDNFAAGSRATRELQPYRTCPGSASTSSAVTERRSNKRPSARNRWPALIAQQQQSPKETFQAQQRQARLNKEQAGVD
jgi:hypothetical protein